jgi:hypothetical protein
VLADRDAEPDPHRPTGGHDRVAIEAGVGPDGELAARPSEADPADRLGQEVGGTAGGMGPAFAQASHQHVAGPRGHREQGVIAADLGVAVLKGAFLLEAIRLADRRVEIDREGLGAGTGTGCEGSPEQLPADPVELADVAPAEAAQVGAQGRGCLDVEAQNPARAARSEGVGVVDRVTTRQG